jgi:methionyl-tRNA formyltransferase
MPTLHYFGPPGFLANTALEACLSSGHDIVFRTSTRQYPNRKEEGIQSLAGQTWLVFDSLEKSMAAGPPPGPRDVALSISSPWIFDQETIDLWNGRFFNFHFALLPRFRGGGGQTWQTLAGEKWGGVTLHQLTTKIDAGPILAKTRFWKRQLSP